MTPDDLKRAGVRVRPLAWKPNVKNDPLTGYAYCEALDGDYILHAPRGMS